MLSSEGFANAWGENDKKERTIFLSGGGIVIADYYTGFSKNVSLFNHGFYIARVFYSEIRKIKTSGE